MLNPNLEKGQYTPRLRELTGDALLLLMAGTDSTAHTLVTATYAMLTRPEMLQALVTELKEAIPKRDSLAEWSALEKLPYLRAVVEESLRYVSGPPGRLPRTVPSTGAVFCGRQIPPGTITTSGAYVHHRKPKAFEDPDTFRPERWLHGSTVEMEKESGDLLEGVADVYGLAFFARYCIESPESHDSSGRTYFTSLAYCELYLTLAHLFRKFDLELYQTTPADMEWKDCTVFRMMGHLKVLVKETKD